MDYLLVYGLGVLTGWIILERPQWVTAAKDWLAGYFGFGD